MAIKKDWYARLYEEREELMSKLIKLKHFIDTADIPDMDLLRDQHDIMQQYVAILDRRLEK